MAIPMISNFSTHKQLDETVALLEILALGNRQIAEGRTKPAMEVIARIRREASAREA